MAPKKPSHRILQPLLLLALAMVVSGCGRSNLSILHLQHSIVASEQTLARYELYRNRAICDSMPAVTNLYDAVCAAERLQLYKLKKHLSELKGTTEGLATSGKSCIRVSHTLMNLYTSRSGVNLAGESTYHQAAVDTHNDDHDELSADFKAFALAKIQQGRIFASGIESFETTQTDSLMPSTLSLCAECGGLHVGLDLDTQCQSCGAEAYTFIKFEKTESPVLWQARKKGIATTAAGCAQQSHTDGINQTITGVLPAQP